MPFLAGGSVAALAHANMNAEKSRQSSKDFLPSNIKSTL